MSQESRQSGASSSASLQSECPPGLGFSCGGSAWGRSASLPVWFGAASVPCDCRTESCSFLMAIRGDCPQLLKATCSSLLHGVHQHGCSLPHVQQGRETLARQVLQSYVTQSHTSNHVYSVMFDIFCWLKASHRSCPHSRGGDHR